MFFIALNIFQSWQFVCGILNGNRVTKDFYISVFGKTNPLSKENEDLLLINREFYEGKEYFKNEEDYNKKTLHADDYDVINPNVIKQYDTSFVSTGGHCLRLDSNYIYSTKIEMPYAYITKKDHAWIRVSGNFYVNDNFKKVSLGIVTTFINYKGYGYKYNFNIIENGIESHAEIGKWNYFVFDYLTPEVRSVNDNLNVYFWLQGIYPVYVDNLKVEAFEKK